MKIKRMYLTAKLSIKFWGFIVFFFHTTGKIYDWILKNIFNYTDEQLEELKKEKKESILL